MSDRERVDAYKQVLSKVFGRRLVPRDLIRFVERDLAIGLCLRDDSDDRVSSWCGGCLGGVCARS